MYSVSFHLQEAFANMTKIEHSTVGAVNVLGKDQQYIPEG